MDEFERMVSETVNEDFDNLTKISKAMSEHERQTYANTFPVAIWMVAGPSEDLAIAISVN